MRTKCYCIFCPKHPKHNQRNQLGNPVVGFHVGDFINPSYDHQGSDVDCLEPISDAFEHYFFLDAEDFNYPITAYGDGSSVTGFYSVNGLTLYAGCGNEEYSN